MLLAFAPLALAAPVAHMFWTIRPEFLTAIPVMLWVLWFLKWATAGGIPPGVAR